MALTDHFRTRCRADLEGRYRHIFQQHAGLSANGVGVEPGDFVAGRRIAHGVTGQDSQLVAAHAGKVSSRSACRPEPPVGSDRPKVRTIGGVSLGIGIFVGSISIGYSSGQARSRLKLFHYAA